jgi:hypothetical protein
MDASSSFVILIGSSPGGFQICTNCGSVIDWQSSAVHLLLALKTSIRLMAALSETFSIRIGPSLVSNARGVEKQL